MFAVVKAARDLRAVEENRFFASLVEIAAVPSQAKKYADTLIEHYQKRADQARGERPKAEANVVPWELATQILAERLAVKTRLDGG